MIAHVTDGESTKLLTPVEAARALGRDPKTVREWVAKDLVPGLGVRIGTRVFIRQNALNALLGEPVPEPAGTV